MNLELDGAVILVVGGHGHVGRAIVARLRGEGAMAIPASRHSPGGLVLDASDEASIEAAVGGITQEWGRLDGLVVTAAPSARTLDPTKNGAPEQVLAAVEGKAMTFLRVANAVIPAMSAAGYGRIVGISGQNAFMTGNIAGSVRNAALIITAKNLADSLAGSGVTVNVVNPGLVTDQPSRDIARGNAGESRAEDIAALAAFLLSPMAGAISGESIAVGHRVRGAVAL